MSTIARILKLKKILYFVFYFVHRTEAEKCINMFLQTTLTNKSKVVGGELRKRIPLPIQVRL